MSENGLTAREILLLQVACLAVGVAWDGEREAKLSVYRREMRDWGERVNLVSRGDLDRVVELHFVDSIRPLPYLPSDEGLRVLDLGSGAGFPGLVLKVFRPDLRLVLIEASRKKKAFLQHMVRTLALTDTEALAVRAEDIAGESAHAGAYGAVVTRAMGGMTHVLPLAAPFLAPGGVLMVFKRSDPWSELTEAKEMAAELGFGRPEIAPEAGEIKRGSLVLLRMRD